MLLVDRRREPDSARLPAPCGVMAGANARVS